MVRKILNQVAINSTELHEELKRIQKRDSELGFRAQKTVDYLESLNVLPEKKGKELLAKLQALGVPRLRDVHFHKIIDVMPKSADEVKVVLQGYNVAVAQETCKKIADTVAEFL